jgi:hypothetical protein
MPAGENAGLVQAFKWVDLSSFRVSPEEEEEPASEAPASETRRLFFGRTRAFDARSIEDEGEIPFLL